MTPTTSPSQIPGLTGVTAVAAGTHHALALRSDATVWSWGDDSQGQLGMGQMGAPSPTPVQVLSSVTQGPLTAVSAIGADGDHSIAIDPTPNTAAVLLDFGRHYDAVGSLANCVEAMPRNSDTNPVPIPFPVPIPPAIPVDSKVGGPNQQLFLYRAGGSTPANMTPRPPFYLNKPDPNGDVKPWGQNGLSTWTTVIQACYNPDSDLTIVNKGKVQILARTPTTLGEPTLSTIPGLGIVMDPKGASDPNWVGHQFLYATASEQRMLDWAATKAFVNPNGAANPDILSSGILITIVGPVKCPLPPGP